MIQIRLLQNEKAVAWSIFALFMVMRLVFKAVSGYSCFELFEDSYRYDILSDRILAGNYDLDFTAYLIAPLLPYFLALMKVLFGEYWQFWAMLVQFTAVSASGVYLFKLTKNLFQSPRIAGLAALAYCFFPMTLWLNFTFSQETLFQSFFIISIYFLLQSLEHKRRTLVLSAVFFSLAFLAKSHGLLYAPCIVIVYLANKKFSLLQKVAYAASYGFICLLFTLPNGYYNWQRHGVYTFSSYGTATLFYYGNCFYTYQTTFFPKRHDYRNAFIFDPDFVHPGYGQVNGLPHRQKAALYTRMATDWIRRQPMQFLELKWFSVQRFFAPGVSLRHYPFSQWLVTFACSLPVYGLAYLGIWQALRRQFARHLWMLLLMLTMLLFFVIFAPLARFRTVTLEPFYLMYAAYALYVILQKRMPFLANRNRKRAEN
jgi:hypothetical protein